MCSIVSKVNSETKSIKSQTNPIKDFFFAFLLVLLVNFIDFASEFTVEILEHKVASYKTSDFT
jgi:hypothetical protein